MQGFALDRLCFQQLHRDCLHQVAAVANDRQCLLVDGLDNVFDLAIDGLGGFLAHRAATVAHALIEKHGACPLLVGQRPQYLAHAKGGDHLLG